MNNMDFEKARYNMVEQQIRPWDVLDDHVLNTIRSLKREDFVPQQYKNLAYVDTHIPLGQFEDHISYMLKPNLEGRLLQHLNITGEDTLLEVGTGCGYLTACMASMARHVDTVDINPEFTALAEKNLAAIGLDNVNFSTGDASNGWDQKRFYDVIAINGSLPEIPEAFKKLLKHDGRMFIVTGEAPAMTAQLVTRIDDDSWTVEDLFETSIERLVHAKSKEQFVF